jgi:hypothetical protein
MDRYQIFEAFLFIAGVGVIAFCINVLMKDIRERQEANANNKKFRSTDGE